VKRGEVWEVEFPAPAGAPTRRNADPNVILDRLGNVTVAPVNSKIGSIPTEVGVDEEPNRRGRAVGSRRGLDRWMGRTPGES